jgi:hypothetical protein
MTFNSVPFKIINDTGSYNINQTIYEMECNAFEINGKFDYTVVMVHHYFKTDDEMKV